MFRSLHIDEDELRDGWLDETILIADMAARFGCSTQTLKSRAVALGLPDRRRGRKPVAALTGGRWVRCPRRHVMVWIQDGVA